MSKKKFKRIIFKSKKIKSFSKSIHRIYIKFNSNVFLKYIVFVIIALFISSIFLAPTEIDPSTNETMFSNYIGWKFKDHSAFVAAIIGIFAFFATLYNVDMNFKSTKLSSLPNDAVDLMIHLEYSFNEFKIDKQNNEEDIIIFFRDILRVWEKHQKAFRLLAPNFYKNFLELYSKPKKIDTGNIAQINSEFIIKAIQTQIIDIAFEKNMSKFYFIKPSLIINDKNIRDIENSKENYDYYELNKKGLKSYINHLTGETKLLTDEKFDDFCFDLEELLDDLKEEIGNYDLL